VISYEAPDSLGVCGCPSPRACGRIADLKSVPLAVPLTPTRQLSFAEPGGPRRVALALGVMG
jgi:hypothetical protein